LPISISSVRNVITIQAKLNFSHFSKRKNDGIPYFMNAWRDSEELWYVSVWTAHVYKSQGRSEWEIYLRYCSSQTWNNSLIKNRHAANYGKCIWQ
jgi:hypothetical protein